MEHAQRSTKLCTLGGHATGRPTGNDARNPLCRRRRPTGNRNLCPGPRSRPCQCAHSLAARTAARLNSFATDSPRPTCPTKERSRGNCRIFLRRSRAVAKHGLANTTDISRLILKPGTFQQICHNQPGQSPLPTTTTAHARSSPNRRRHHRDLSIAPLPHF